MYGTETDTVKQKNDETFNLYTSVSCGLSVYPIFIGNKLHYFFYLGYNLNEYYTNDNKTTYINIIH